MKILSRSELQSARARLRDVGQKLVFTNGVFDILHVGHVRYLQQARELGDALVVAINSDASTPSRNAITNWSKSCPTIIFSLQLCHSSR